MEIKELQGLLKQDYTRENWQKIFQEILPNVSLRSHTIRVKSNKNNSNIEHFDEIGESLLPNGEIVKLFEVKVTENTNLIRNRVALNKEISSHIGYGQADGVIAIFEKGKNEYRLTFSASGTKYDLETEDFIENNTDPKRLTYLLGRTESCKTPASRLNIIKTNKDKLNIDHIQEAFNVETLSKLFFKEYIEHFNGLVASLKSKPSYFQGIFEKEETATRNFVKRFMGRLVFLKFIQKKGWLGVPVSEKGWNNGEYQFLEDQYKVFDNKGQFVSQFLNPLFFEALNVGNRPKDEFQRRGYKIPYLSGGLFDNDNPKENRIDFEERELTNLFDFFERYNFTIDENDLHDKEVGIDPEMLGHIFENLLEDNKDKGAFYTPKEIVRYMCQESLKEYLKTYLEKEKLWPADETASQNLTKTIAAFVEKKETAAILRYDKELATALRDVKICDPAIGSGAFPMGLLNEIFTMIKNLHDESPDRVGDVWNMEGKKWQPNIVKQNIIQNSIYGVDIEAGAVDIARLRFWLSLVIEETEPKPLPHLDYKIVVGNSLVSKLEDTVIDIEWDLKPQLVQADIFGNEGKVTQKRELIREITTLQKQVFEPDSNEEELSIAIRNKKIDLLVLQLEIMIDEKGVTDKPQGTGRNITSMTQKWLETKGWQQQIAKLKTMKQGTQTPLVFFDWLLDFPEVMNPEVNKNPGFDIVIGNPPYVNVEKIEASIKANIKKFKTAFQKYDLYVLFYELAISLSKEKGVLSYITSNKFLAQGYGLKLRELMLKYEILDIVNFNYDIFESATVRTCILNLKKTPYNNSDINVIDCNKSIDKHKFLNKVSTLLNQKIFINLENFNFRINLNNEKLRILSKIDEKSILLNEILSIHYGVRPSSEKLKKKKEYFIHENNSDGKFKPYFEGKDMGYWHIKSSQYLNYQPEVMYNSMFKELFENEKLVGLRTLSDITKLRFIYDNQNYYCNDSVVVLVKWDDIKKVKHTSVSRNINEERIENSKNVSLRYIQAILNSRLIKFYFDEYYYDGTHFYPNHMKILPIVIAPEIIQKQLSILATKNFTEESATNSDIKEDLIINNIVYKLYNLTYEEACIVEPELPTRLTKAAYEAIEI